MIITIRTDKPESEIGLYDGTEKRSYIKWQAHRQLSETIHQRLAAILRQNNLDWVDIKGIIFYKGPGSFTGLRIGASVANTLAYGLSVPLVGGGGEDWLHASLHDLLDGKNDGQIVPDYGRDPHITQPRK